MTTCTLHWASDTMWKAAPVTSTRLPLQASYHDNFTVWHLRACWRSHRMQRSCRWQGIMQLP